MKRIRRTCLMLLALAVTGASAMMGGTSQVQPYHDGQDTARHDTAFIDTLHEVTVMGDSLKLAPVKDAIGQSLGRGNGPQVKSLGEVLNKIAPGAMDYVLHPFGFAERKKKKKKKRVQQILREYDRIDAKDEFTLKLDSVLRIEGLK